MKEKAIKTAKHLCRLLTRAEAYQTSKNFFDRGLDAEDEQEGVYDILVAWAIRHFVENPQEVGNWYTT